MPHDPKSMHVTLQDEIDHVLLHMNDLEPYSEDYVTAMKNLKVLHELQNELRSRNSISPETALTVGANLAGILLVLNFEKIGIVTSKAFGLVTKLKI